MTEAAPIDQLLSRWRAARHPSTSELIQRIGDGLEVSVSRLPAKKNDAARALLLALKSEPPFLLSARLRQVEAFARTTTVSVVWPLFEALSKLPADPRIATLATRLLVGNLEVPLTSKLTRRLLDCVETHGDDAHYRALELGFQLNLLDDGLAGRAVRMLQKGLARRPQGPELPAADRRRLAETKWQVPAATVEVGSLYAPVWAAPRDRGARQVLADQLIERGDPRGEYISLQLAGASPKRQRTLLKKHGREWLGALADVVDLKDEPPVFKDGFVAVVSVRAVRPAQFLLGADAPEWATVRRVRRGLQRISRAMVGLEDAGRVKLEVLRAATREAVPLVLRSIGLVANPDQAVEVLEKLEQSPRWLGLHFPVFEPTRELRDSLPRLGDLHGLERLRFSAESATVMPALLGEMGLAWVPAGVPRVELRDGDQLIIFERDRKQWNVDLMDLSTHGPEMLKWKRTLPELRWLQPSRVRVLTRVEVEDERVKELEHQARRFNLPVVTSSLDDVPEEVSW